MFSLAGISVSMAITTTLNTIAAVGIWKAFIEPVKKAWDKAVELAGKLNTLKLNSEAKAEQLGITRQSVEDHISGTINSAFDNMDPSELEALFDFSKLVSLGKGVVDESFSIAEAMVNTSGKSTMAY